MLHKESAHASDVSSTVNTSVMSSEVVNASISFGQSLETTKTILL